MKISFISGSLRRAVRSPVKSVKTKYLDLVTSQRGNEMLKFKGYVYSKSKQVKERVYWVCRYRNSANHQYCKARLVTSAIPGGHRIDYSVIDHNHEAQSKRLDNSGKPDVYYGHINHHHHRR